MSQALVNPYLDRGKGSWLLFIQAISTQLPGTPYVCFDGNKNTDCGIFSLKCSSVCTWVSETLYALINSSLSLPLSSPWQLPLYNVSVSLIISPTSGKWNHAVFSPPHVGDFTYHNVT